MGLSSDLSSEWIDALPPVWKERFTGLPSELFFKKLMQFLDSEYQAQKEIYPSKAQVMRALTALDLPDVKVVILGQDPYHGSGQAMGLSFAVPNELFPKPPSLQNIFKELKTDLGISVAKDQSDLTGWVQQGVLLLNTVLTVEASKPLSHRDQGWEQFTDRVMMELGSRSQPLVFILWGGHAQKMKSKINLQTHRVIESPHPSPLSSYRGFFGSKPFSRANEYLKEMNQSPIRWGQIIKCPLTLLILFGRF